MRNSSKSNRLAVPNMIKLILFVLVLVASTANARTFEELAEDTFVRAHLSIVSWISPENDFGDDDTERGALRAQGGLLVSHQFSSRVIARIFSTTDHAIDYGFLQLSLLDKELSDTNIGIRAGRVNRLSGVFGGFGPHSDDMNFLPQGTSPDRIGRSMFRFDGVQLFLEKSFLRNHNFGIEVSYGNGILEEGTSIFDPAFYVVFEADSTVVSDNRPIFVLNLSYNSPKWQVFVDYIDIDFNIASVYENDLMLSELYPDIPPELDRVVHISEPSSVDSYPAHTLKIGIVRSFEDFELMATYFVQVGESDGSQFAFLGSTAGTNFQPYAYTLMARYYFLNNTTVYGGATYYKSDFDNEAIAVFKKEAPDWVDYGKGIFFGIRKQIDPHIHIIAEASFNEGGAFLSATHQDPTTTEKYWGVYSMSVNFVF